MTGDERFINRRWGGKTQRQAAVQIGKAPFKPGKCLIQPCAGMHERAVAHPC